MRVWGDGGELMTSATAQARGGSPWPEQQPTSLPPLESARLSPRRKGAAAARGAFGGTFNFLFFFFPLLRGGN